MSHENLEVEKFLKDGWIFLIKKCLLLFVPPSVSFGLGEDNIKMDIYLDLGLPMIAKNHVRHGNDFTSRPEGSLSRLVLPGKWGRRTTKDQREFLGASTVQHAIEDLNYMGFKRASRKNKVTFHDSKVSWEHRVKYKII